MSEEIVIVSALRTPIGAFQGELSTVSAPLLASFVIRAIIDETDLDASMVDEVLMGNVLSAGVGQAPARQASLAANMPLSTSCTAVSKVCGSGMKAAMLAYDQISAGSIDIAIAGGMENMSLAPYILMKARGGQRIGHGSMIDHMFYDGLENAYDGNLMGNIADVNAQEDKITREQIDDYCIDSLNKAKNASDKGYFDSEIVPITLQSKREDKVVNRDELPQKGIVEKIPMLSPSFGKNGVITAAGSGSISDGAAALLLMTRQKAELLNLKPLAIVRGHSTHSCEPEKYTHAPISAVTKLLNKVNWSVGDVDLFEINEAFATVPMAAINALGLSYNKTNINGGATALGHPIGASGARIIVTLLHALKRTNKTKGVASLCIGGGEGTALAIELI